jgi:type II secretory pathway component PulF
MIFDSMGLGSMPAFSLMVFSQGRVFLLLQSGFLLLLWALMLAYIGGPRLREWISRWLPGAPDALALLLPWKRKRLQRDFSSMLAMLLDANVPEAEAVTIAAEATANRVMIRRGGKLRELLAQGVKLPVALREMDDAGELRWRLANALQARGGFLRALNGWHESLDAKAFQVEQASAQVATTALVLVNGAMVACIVIAVFLLLINLINEACLW